MFAIEILLSGLLIGIPMYLLARWELENSVKKDIERIRLEAIEEREKIRKEYGK